MKLGYYTDYLPDMYFVLFKPEDSELVTLVGTKGFSVKNTLIRLRINILEMDDPVLLKEFNPYIVNKLKRLYS